MIVESIQCRTMSASGSIQTNQPVAMGTEFFNPGAKLIASKDLIFKGQFHDPKLL